MKQSIFLRKSILLVAMMGITQLTNAQRYEIDHDRVYFDRELLKYADAHTFRDLSCGYAKDMYNVYMDGRVLENVDPASFRLKESTSWRNRKGINEPLSSIRGYYKTKFNVYYGDKKIDAVPGSFKELGGGYAKDAFNVFYYGEKIKGAMATSFKYKGNGYAEDSFDVYYRGKKIE